MGVEFGGNVGVSGVRKGGGCGFYESFRFVAPKERRGERDQLTSHRCSRWLLSVVCIVGKYFFVFVGLKFTLFGSPARLLFSPGKSLESYLCRYGTIIERVRLDPID